MESREQVLYGITAASSEMILNFGKKGRKQLSEDSQRSNGNQELGIPSSFRFNAVSLCICQSCLIVEPGPYCSDSGRNLQDFGFSCACLF